MEANDLKYIWEYKDWTNFSWDANVLLPLLSKARQLQGKMLTRVRSLTADSIGEAQAEILTEEALQTSAIEGELLNRNSVRSSVARHLGLDEAGLSKVDRNVDGLVEVLIDATSNYDKSLTAQRLKGWQAALFPTGYSGLYQIRVGKWRNGDVQVVSGAVGKQRVHFQAPPVDQVEKEMKMFLDWWKKSDGKVEGFLRAGIAHFWFVTIHPFEDGNGRLTRALTDMALAQDEKCSTRFYSFSSQIMEERQNYYDVLEQSSKGKVDLTLWLSWFLQCLIRAMERSEHIISKVLAKADFWQKHAQTHMNERQRKVVNRLLDAGKGCFEGGLTTRKYVSLAKTSRATAFREIDDLVKKGVLVKNPFAQGRSVKYDLNWEL